MPSPDIYNQLSGVLIDDATVAQLDYTRNTYVDTKSIKYWQGIITISKILEASRTYAHGLPVPEVSAVKSALVLLGQPDAFIPSGSEIYLIQSIFNTGGTVTLVLSDGVTTSELKSLATGASYQPTAPLYLTNSLYLAMSAESGDCTVNIAYHKVSL
jgi:hypothetical protein